ncbi:MAG: D-alanyl-D-alanine carboxypeptidase [Bacteroidales bacterium]|nr:D-alanyl-D-alanine carboxypeptidase [Bacteroidales bacterium]
MTLEGEVLADWNSQVCLLPASNVKLITTALALNTLGPDFRYETSLGYHGRIDEGKLSGDLYILGSGDPTLGMREYDAHSDIFRQWKGILALHGINEIDGRIIADHRPMGIIPVNPGWLLEDVVCGDGLDSRGLNYSRNVVNSAHLFDYGFVAVPTPSNDCAAAFGKYLQEMGYIVTGEYADDSAEGVLGRDEIAVLGSTCSYKLSQIVSFTNAKSDNFCAEALMNKVLEVTTLSEAMNDLGITDMRGCRIVDGCGLSRKNYVSPAFFCDFLSAMARKNCFRDYLASLPQPGKGTLASKLHNEPESVKRRVYMKSGTMTGVRCFSGYVLPRNGDLSRLIMFSIMTNNVSAPSAIESSCIDRIIAAIAARN